MAINPISEISSLRAGDWSWFRLLGFKRHQKLRFGHGARSGLAHVVLVVEQHIKDTARSLLDAIGRSMDNGFRIGRTHFCHIHPMKLSRSHPRHGEFGVTIGDLVANKTQSPRVDFPNFVDALTVEFETPSNERCLETRMVVPSSRDRLPRHLRRSGDRCRCGTDRELVYRLLHCRGNDLQDV